MILLKAKLVSKVPFIIGDCETDVTDTGILKDADGIPYIPGTSLAGVCRHFMEMQGSDSRELFGFAEGKNAEDSRIVFYDAICTSKVERMYTSLRDSVRLENRLAVDKSKFDFEIANSGLEFRLRLEIRDQKSGENGSRSSDPGKDEMFLCQIVDGFNNGDIRLGAKTTRGFGVFEIQDIKIKKLDLKSENDMKFYIHELNDSGDWNAVDDTKAWDIVKEKWEGKKNSGDCYKEVYEEIKAELSLKSYLYLRDYASLVKAEPGGEKFVDAQTLCDEYGNALIPGTALAGTFRHHCKYILEKVKMDPKKIKDFLNQLFGYQRDADDHSSTKTKQKSRILFEEIAVCKDELSMINRTRTAVDRFTGGALQTGALFTGRIACKKDEKRPKITLIIKINTAKLSKEEQTLARSLIRICIEDMKQGYLNVGGDAAIGAGIFEAYQEA